MTQEHRGSCFCGSIEIVAKGEPVEMGYCHCSDCQSYAGAPLVSFTLWQRENLSIVKGAELLASFNKAGTTERQYCLRCGGHLVNDHAQWGVADVPAALLPTVAFEPSVHLHYGSAVLPVRDGLPKLRDFPAEVGGTGELLAE